MSKGKETRKKIKECSIELFNKKGYTETTMNEIANAVGIKAATLYFHYESKENIFFSILEDGLEIYERKLNEIMDSIEKYDIETNLYEVLTIPIRMCIYHKESCKFMFRNFIFPIAGFEDKISAIYKRKRAEITELVVQLFSIAVKNKILKDMPIDDLVKSYYRFSRGYILQMLMWEYVPDEEEIKKVWNIYLYGIKANI